MKAKFIIALLLLIGTWSLGAQEEVPVQLADGLRAFQAGTLETALESFQEALARDDIPAWEGHALFWAGRTQMALRRYEEAADSFDLFLSRFADHPYREESHYQRARIFYLDGEYDVAILRFAEFMEDYPESEFYANALYWSGESLFSLGRLDEAERFFAEVTDNHPTSYRAEAARYRLDIIELARRENELLTLLQWSHEEYLSALESYQRRERSYQEALESYRERLAGLATEDFQAEIAALNQRIEELETTLSEREGRINELLARLRRLETGEGDAPGLETEQETEGAQAAPAEDERSVRSDLELREMLLSLKAQALELQELLLDDEEGEE
ncbi:MAG: tetratricopeptide repeat protein [Spirochaetota bacterium]